MKTTLRLEMILEHGDVVVVPALVASALEDFADRVRAHGEEMPEAGQVEVPRGKLAYQMTSEVSLNAPRAIL